LNRPSLVFAAVALAVSPLPCAAQTLTKCVAGQPVVDQEGRIGTIVSQGSALCQVRYSTGETYGWIYWNLRPAPGAAQPDLPAANSRPTPPPKAVGPMADDPSVTVLRPATSHSRVYHAGANGHFMISAEVNRAPIEFLVDTGASLVFLTADDARNAGFNPRELNYTQFVSTGNGSARAAPVKLSEIRIGDLSVDNVRAAVLDNLGQSVLGMSFLNRLKGFEMREGSLTIDW
jgi:clan AA aspartic protease (TIGR02281 family)